MLKNIVYFFKLFVVFTSLTSFPSVKAAPWVNTDDAYLQQSIQQLANAGFIKTPINTWPLMWQPILQDISVIDLNQLSDAQQHAYFRIKAAASFAQQPSIKRISVEGASASLDSLGFNDSYPNTAMLKIGTEVTANNWSAGVNKQFRYKNNFNATDFDEDNYQSTWDNTYAAYAAGNWVFVASLQPQWWGPAIGSSFHSNTNQRPTRNLQFGRLNPAEPLHERLAWLGAISLNVQYGYYSGKDILRHANYFASRVGLKPLQTIELGLSQRHIKLKQPPLGLVLSPINIDDIRTLGVDVNYNLNSEAAIYAEVSSQMSRADDERATAWLLGAKYHTGTQAMLVRYFAEYQELPVTYFAWQALTSQTEMHPHRRQWQVGMHVSKPNGQAGYFSLSHREHHNQESENSRSLFNIFAQSNNRYVNVLNIGYQQAVFDGLLKLDFQLTKLEKLNQQGITKTHYSNSVGGKWEWRW